MKEHDEWAPEIEPEHANQWTDEDQAPLLFEAYTIVQFVRKVFAILLISHHTFLILIGIHLQVKWHSDAHWLEEAM